MRRTGGRTRAERGWRCANCHTVCNFEGSVPRGCLTDGVRDVGRRTRLHRATFGVVSGDARHCIGRERMMSRPTPREASGESGTSVAREKRLRYLGIFGRPTWTARLTDWGYLGRPTLAFRLTDSGNSVYRNRRRGRGFVVAAAFVRCRLSFVLNLSAKGRETSTKLDDARRHRQQDPKRGNCHTVCNFEGSCPHGGLAFGGVRRLVLIGVVNELERIGTNSW